MIHMFEKDNHKKFVYSFFKYVTVYLALRDIWILTILVGM